MVSKNLRLQTHQDFMQDRQGFLHRLQGNAGPVSPLRPEKKQS